MPIINLETASWL
ncbi:uncharacterized protein FTOL_13974 [Fusarium torulosum]|uniref:Uncharacterized protein n=1 Tax=Fusarium torulosum TaxID=33205 RepID=A0AAE8MN41_9HYPO|nr:uncharacterized protein FTOL_13974 [Fusarium torulosum]